MASAKSKSGASSVSPRKKADSVSSISVAEFYEREDNEASAVNWDTLEKTFLSHSNQVRKQIDELADSKIKDEGTANVEESVILKLLLMRRLNRLAMYRNRRDRDLASEMRANVDEKFLQLQNANNEIEHIRKEIDRCFEFKSADEEIDLVPTEEFYANAPATLSREEVTRSDPHEQHIARLNWEMVERRNLVGTLQEREGRKNVLLSDISKKESRLKSLKPRIEAIIETARPVQQEMSLKTVSAASDEQRRMFTFLPKELAIIAIQTEAYRDIAEEPGVSVQYQGDIESAMKYLENSNRASSSVEDEEDLSDTVSGTASPARAIKRRRSTASQQIARKKDLILVEHPMSLVLTVQCTGDITVSLCMHYLPELHAVSTKAKLSGSSLPFYGNLLCDESLLIDLFPKDDGERCSDAIGQVKLEQLRVNVSDYEGRIGRFFLFAQRMAGIDKEGYGDVRLCDIIESVITELRYRVRTRATLIRCIKSLSSLKLFDEMPREQRIRYPSKILSRLTEFKMLTSTQFLSAPVVTADYSKLIDTERSSSIENQFFFSATIERQPGVTLFALIYIGSTYPKYSRPIFVLSVTVNGVVLTARNCSSVVALESDVNLNDISLHGCESEIGLDAQIAFLVSRFDCFLEVESARNESGQFPKEHLFLRSSRGRDRELPLAFDNSAGAFTFV